MAVEIFDRYEEKYIISDEVYRRIKPQMEEYMEIDEHSKNGSLYTICNIYFDTPDNEIIRKSIEKPVFKEKLRLRSYGTVKLEDTVYLEIKRKFDGKVTKRRTALTLSDAYRYITTGQKPEAKNKLNGQILNEIDFLLHKYPSIYPAVFLSYDRNALYGLEDPDFRITFDTNIRTRRYDVGLEKGIYGDLLLPQDQWIMEVKIKDVVPLWFAKLLSGYHIFPVSFSKYGMEYRKTMLQSSDKHISLEYNKLYA